jgi:hypothetical protein
MLQDDIYGRSNTHGVSIVLTSFLLAALKTIETGALLMLKLSGAANRHTLAVKRKRVGGWGDSLRATSFLKSESEAPRALMLILPA